MSENKVHLSQNDILEIANFVGSGSTTALIRQGDSPALLAASGSFYGDVVYVGGYTHLCGFVFSNVSSATNGLVIEQGMQASDFDILTPALSTANVTRSRFAITGGDIDLNIINVQLVAPFVRIVYTNGGSPQTSFRIYGFARVLRGL